MKTNLHVKYFVLNLTFLNDIIEREMIIFPSGKPLINEN